MGIGRQLPGSWHRVVRADGTCATCNCAILFSNIGFTFVDLIFLSHGIFHISELRGGNETENEIAIGPKEGVTLF